MKFSAASTGFSTGALLAVVATGTDRVTFGMGGVVKKAGLLFALAVLLLPATSIGTQLKYFSGSLAPLTFAGAGHFDGSTLVFDVTDPSTATWFGADASASLSTGTGSINIGGTAQARNAGEGAGSKVLVPFTLLGGPAPYLFSPSSSANPNTGWLNSAGAYLGIFDTQTYIDTGLVYLTNLLPASGVISNSLLDAGEAFFVIGFANEAKNPNSTSPQLYDASFRASFVLNPSTVPEPASIWLLISASSAMFAVIRRRRG